MFKNNYKISLYIAFILSFSKAQDVIITVGDTVFSGYTEDIVVPITISNPNGNVGGVQFDVSVSPNMVPLSGVSALGIASNFSAHYSTLNNGNSRVIFYNGNDPDGLNAGENSRIINLHFSGSDVLSAVLEAKLNNVIVSDGGGNIVSSQSFSGSILIGDLIYLSGSSATADVEETIGVDFSITNSGIVGGFQFDLKDSPNYLNLVSVATTDRSQGFNVEFNNLDDGAGSRIIMYSSNNINIEAGSGPVVTATFEVISTAYADTVSVYADNITVTDSVGASYWIASADSGNVIVYPGYIEEPSNLQAIDGQDSYVALSWDPPSGPIPDNITEDFESGAPADWVFSSNNSVGWFLTDNCDSEWWTVPAHTNYMCSNDDALLETGPDSDGSLDYMIIPSLNVSGATSVILNFDSYFDGAYGQGASIGISDDGSNFTEVFVLDPATQWVTETVDLSPFITGDNLHILFHSNDNAGWASGWAVDDISISFETREIPARLIHYNLTEIGDWVVTAPKQDVIQSFRGGIPFADRIDLENPISLNIDRPVNIDAYKVYKSLNGLNGFEEIVEVEGNITSYTDENVSNNTSYYYYVTAIYPDGSESVPTNVVSATPVEWIELSISNGESLIGQTDTIDISLNNESLLGQFIFEIEDFPDVLVGENILTTERTQDWQLSFFEDNGKIAVQGFGTLAGVDPLQPGNGPVCRVVVRPQGDQSLTVSLTLTDVEIQDASTPPVELNWTAEVGSYEVGVETQFIMLTDGSSVPGTQMTSSMCLINTQPVYGIQVDFVMDPPFLYGSGIDVTSLLDLSTWSVSSQQVANVFTLLLFDNTLSNPVPPGYWYLGEVILDVIPGSPEDYIVDIQYGQMTLSDANNQPLISAGLPSEVYIGEPPASYSIQNVEGLLAPGGEGSFEVHLANTEIVGTISFLLSDAPEYLTVTSMEAIGRFASGIIDQSSGEDSNNENFYFLGYDFTGGGIPVGDGPVLKVNVQMDQYIDNPNVMLLFEEVSAGDAGANSIMAASQGLGLFTTTLMSASTDLVMPQEFSLHANFPNPFNPSTVITYDLASDGYVDLSVYNVVGKKVKTIVNKNETAGRKVTAWYGTDDSGNSLSAGMYFYRLTAGGKVFTKKMVLMK